MKKYFPKTKCTYLLSIFFNLSDLKATLKNLCQTELKTSIEIFNPSQSKKANLVVAHDTRSSCALLLDGFKTGAELLQANVINYGLLTTPQLHYMVRCLNTNGEYGEPSEEGYYKKISQAFFNVWSMVIFFYNLVLKNLSKVRIS